MEYNFGLSKGDRNGEVTLLVRWPLYLTDTFSDSGYSIYSFRFFPFIISFCCFLLECLMHILYCINLDIVT